MIKTNKLKKISIKIAAISVAIFSIALNPHVVSAVSAYDDVIENTPSIVLKRGSAVQDITATYLDLVQDCNRWTSMAQHYGISCVNFTSKLHDAFDNTSGWYVTERTAKVPLSIGLQSLSVGDKFVILGVNDAVDNNGQFITVNGNKGLYLRGSNQTCAAYLALDDQSNLVVSNAPCTTGTGEAARAEVANNYSIWSSQLLLFNSSIDYPVDYEGEIAYTSDGWADLDGDGLIASQETTQGTSNTNKDTDGDGLDDYIESQWNPERDNVFCGTQCAYPDPTTKDVYVETDWMKDSSNNVYKPSLTQIGLVQAMFDDKDIILHVDTGQFGGGNELSTYTQTLSYIATPGQIDFWDYKNGGDGITANFDPDRSSIWRYVIYGYDYLEHLGSTGWAETMGDDLFISLGRIEAMSGIVSLDRAVAGTMAHEIGHSLCLSDHKVFEEQPDECVYGGIDNDNENDSDYNLESYASVMNYRYQLTNHDDLGVVDYSDGSHGVGDHDDWSALALGMGGFSGTRTALGVEEIASNYYVTPDGSVIVEEATIEEMSPESTRSQGQKDDDPLKIDAVKSNTDDSDVELSKDETNSATTSHDWISLMVTGGGVALLTVGGVLLYLKKRNK